MNKFRLMSFLVVLAMVFSFANFSTASAAGPNLIVNGSFEDWDYAGGYNTGDPMPTGWERWPGYKDCYVRGTNSNLSGAAPDGNYFFQLCGNNVHGIASFYQNVSSVAGVTHTLTYNLGVLGRGYGPYMNVLVYHASNLNTPIAQTGYQQAYGWRQITLVFTPSEADIVVRFIEAGSSNGRDPLVDNVQLTIPNSPPVANAGGPYEGGEGLAIALNGSASYDPDGNPLTYNWTVSDPGVCAFDDPTAVEPILTCNDNGDFPADITVNDGIASDSDDTVVSVRNIIPSLGEISIDQVLVPVGTVVNASASFTDPGTLDTHSATWDWGDGTSAGTVTQGAGFGSVNDSHSYSVPGVYTVMLSVADDDSGVDEAVYQYVVVYDPSGGFVTGGGWIDSPAGAYADNLDLTGKASFGFVAKYKKGANVPDGNTQFQFKSGNLNFHSTSYEWLVVAGNKAQFKGEGTINGEGSYKFMIWADDDSPDTFRIQISGDNGVVYDNGSQQSLGGGSIKVHNK